jgi:PAS domain S-box-containing protein
VPARGSSNPTSAVGEIAVDLFGVITGFDGPIEGALGYSRSELIGRPFREMFTDPNRAEEGLHLALSGSRVAGGSLALRARTTEDFVGVWDFRPRRAEDGRLSGVSARLFVTGPALDRDRALLESAVYQRGLIEAAPDAIFTVDSDLRITDVNEEMVRSTGYARKTLLGRPISSVIAESPRAEHAIRSALQRRRVTDCEVSLISRDGRSIPIALNAGPLFDSQGEVAGVLATARDVTVQRALASELRESRNYSRMLVESSLDGMITTDLLGNVTDVNWRMESLLARRREGLRGGSFRDQFMNSDEADQVVARVLRDGRATDVNLQLRDSGGGIVDLSCNATAIRDDEGRLKGMLATVRDVTEQKALRDELTRRNEELETLYSEAQKASRFKSEFLTSLSHELRTPLNSVIGFSEVLLSDDRSALTDEQREYLEDILKSGDHLLRLINNLLDLAKVESGKVEALPEPFSLRAVIEEVVSTLRPQLEGKRLALESRSEGDLDRVVLDPMRLKQILYNLLSNAVKFTDPDGSISVVATPAGPGRFELRVSDTGIGIPAEDRSRLFQPFEQLVASPGRRRAGSGLGLSLTRALVELQKGTIELTSEVGRGTTVCVSLPIDLTLERA